MKKRKSMYQRLNKKQQKHIRDNFDGPASRITLARVQEAVDCQRAAGHFNRCWECEGILRKLQGGKA